jgi:hypothetical protein
MIPVETSRNGGKEIKGNGKGVEFKYDILLRTFVYATMYPHPAKQFLKKDFKLCFICTVEYLWSYVVEFIFECVI